MNFAENIAAIVGRENVVTSEAAEPYLLDWRGVFSGRARCVVRPGTTAEVAEIVKLCFRNHIPIVPQGGNTGLVGGATPTKAGNAVVVSTARLNRIRDIDTTNDTVTVEAGCILQTLQESCANAGRLFPLSLAAEGSCTIGGNLSTNAGGTQVLRYGTMRELTLGLEVVTAKGEVWDGLRSLRKDNTGYDLKSLMIGGEGTLGIITAAVLRLFPLPRTQVTAFVASSDISACIALLQRLRAAVGESLTAFEIISGSCLSLVTKHFPEQRTPFAAPKADSSWYALIEVAGPAEENDAREALTMTLASSLDSGEIYDAVIAANLAQRREFWHLRESITLAQARAGRGVKHDISLPLSTMARFLESTGQALEHLMPGLAIMPFGHLGDGNLHYNVGSSVSINDADVVREQNKIYTIVHDAVAALGGSISAEHGIGQLKRAELLRYKQPIELDMMRAIKRALDPHNLFNPGKMLP